MQYRLLTLGFLASISLAGQTAAWAGQAPGAASDPDIPVSHRDRVYSADSFPTPSRSPIPSKTGWSV
jgi:hypothetical protein